MSVGYTTISRERYHMFEVTFLYNKNVYALKVFINHNRPDKFWMVNAHDNSKISWGTEQSPEVVRDDVLHKCLIEIARRTNRTYSAERDCVITGFNNSSQRNLCMHVFAATGDPQKSNRYRLFFEYRKDLRYHFWTTNPTSNDLSEPGDPVDLDQESIDTFKAAASAFLNAQFVRREARSFRAQQSSGLGDQIAAAMDL